MKGAATRYPQVDSKTGRLMNLADRINECRLERQSTERLGAESDELLSLTAHVTAESRAAVRRRYRRRSETVFRCRTGLLFHPPRPAQPRL